MSRPVRRNDPREGGDVDVRVGSLDALRTDLESEAYRLKSLRINGPPRHPDAGRGGFPHDITEGIRAGGNDLRAPNRPIGARPRVVSGYTDLLRTRREWDFNIESVH